MGILETMLPMKKSVGELTFKRRKSDGRVIVSKKIETFHNQRTVSSMRNKLSMVNTQAMYRYVKENFGENREADGSNRNAYLTYLHLNKALTRCWLPQEEKRCGNAILEAHYISNGTLQPVMCGLDDEGRVVTDIALGMETLEGVTVGEWARDLLEHNDEYQPYDLLKFVHLRQTSRKPLPTGHTEHRIEDSSRLLLLDPVDGRLLDDVLDGHMWGVRDGRIAMLEPLSYAAATVVHLRPQEGYRGHGGARVFDTLAKHLAAGLALATYRKPDGQPMAVRASRQQLLCINPLIDEYATEERFVEVAHSFGPMRDGNEG